LVNVKLDLISSVQLLKCDQQLHHGNASASIWGKTLPFEAKENLVDYPLLEDDR
jgi:hypothetical protein